MANEHLHGVYRSFDRPDLNRIPDWAWVEPTGDLVHEKDYRNRNLLPLWDDLPTRTAFNEIARIESRLAPKRLELRQLQDARRRRGSVKTGPFRGPGDPTDKQIRDLEKEIARDTEARNKLCRQMSSPAAAG